MWRRASVATAVALLVGLPAVAQAPDTHYRDFGDPGGFWNILPPGQDGLLNGPEALQAAAGGPTPPHFDDQLAMYGDLVYEDATPGFSADDLPRFFKDASFGVPPEDVERVYQPGGRDDVTIIRDRFGVPHIFGTTRDGTMFAQGYATAEDRLFLMDVLRHVGRAELSAWLGPAPGNQALDRDQMAVAPYTDEDLTRQLEDIAARYGELGQRGLRDLEMYTAGVNQYIQEALADPTKLPAEYPALQLVPEPWRPEDTVAVASLVGGIFGKGGGREVRNYCGLTKLTDALGPTEARAVFDDLKFADDPEAPTTTRKRFSYLEDLGPTDPAAIPPIDCDSLQPITPPPPGPEDLPGTVLDLVPTVPLGPGAEQRAVELPDGRRIPLVLDHAMSNALLIAADHTTTGAPIAVFGPQTGYFVPQLLVEKDVHGPGISARGASFPGTDLYVQLGRGTDYAWSATSAGGDNVDEFVLRLCEPGAGDPLAAATTESMGYWHDGQCVPIEAHQKVLLAKPSAAGVPEHPGDLIINKYFERAPDYGPLVARGQLTDGTPIAIAEHRSTYMAELGSAVGFSQINDPDFMARGFEAFREAFGNGVDYTFNWFYVDRRHIGYQFSCKCPLRAPGVDPYLPAWGTGEWDWRGWLPFEAKPWDLDPPQGYLVSWNNKQAPGFRSNDGQFGWGPIHRSDLLSRRIEAELAEGPVDVGRAVDVMALAATTDLRAQELMPVLERVMGEDPPSGLDLDPRVAEMWQRLRAWAADDLGHRRDHDRDGRYEHAVAVAIMDAWWGGTPEHPDTARLFDAIFAAGTADARRVLGLSVHDGNLRGHVGSAFQDSLYAHVHKDLRQVLGDPVAGPFHRTYCGDGDLDRCREALWRSLSDTAAALEQEFGSSDVSDWERQVSDDDIRHVVVGVVGVPAIHWQNRPTFQQVVAPPAAAGAAEGAPPPAPPAAPLPATGAGLAWLAGVLALAGSRRRRS